MPSRPIGKSKFEKRWKFRIPIYGYIVYISVTKDMKRSIERAKIHEVDLIGISAMHFPVKGEAVSYLFLPVDADINDLAHESSHVVQSIIDWIGATYQDREFVAYLFGHVTQGIVEFHEHAKKILDKHNIS